MKIRLLWIVNQSFTDAITESIRFAKRTVHAPTISGVSDKWTRQAVVNAGVFAASGYYLMEGIQQIFDERIISYW
jgi:flavin-binding protein dodecin